MESFPNFQILKKLFLDIRNPAQLNVPGELGDDNNLTSIMKIKKQMFNYLTLETLHPLVLNLNHPL